MPGFHPSAAESKAGQRGKRAGQWRLDTASIQESDEVQIDHIFGGFSGVQLPGRPIFGLRITSRVALLKISLLTFTSAGP